MRKILRSSDEVIHFWANQVQSEGRAGNVFFTDNTLYSFGRHFVIGRILSTGVVVLTNLRNSKTTNKHIGMARSAVSHRTCVYTSSPAGYIGNNRIQVESDIRAALIAAESPRIRQATRDGHHAAARHMAEQFNAYRDALIAVGEPMTGDAIDVDALPAIRARIDAEQAEYAAKQAKEQEEYRARVMAVKADGIAAFRAGESTRVYLRDIPVMLRLRDGETVETSHGAEIPTRHAKRAWPIIQQVRERGECVEFAQRHPLGHINPENTTKREGVSMGVYSLSKIRGDGSIVVGCHDIAYSEMVGIAKALGLPTNDPIDA